jgi:predicted GIY-YIG superfamily endonuclease
MNTIYILLLEKNKYYVGKTKDTSVRLNSHFIGNGSLWTKKYKPLSIVETISNCDDYDEDKYTIKYMEKYGINNVRGGSFCQIKLNENNIITLNQMICGNTDKCFICGKSDHYVNDCKKISVNEKIPTINLNEKCDCPTSYFSSHRRGKCLLNNIISYFEDENDNIDEILKYKNVKEETKLSECIKEDKINSKKNNCCYRCGRIGHYVSSCYASTHINGKSLK